MAKKKVKRIILASKSPRRIQLLKSLGLDIIVKPSHIDENLAVSKKDPKRFTKVISFLKADYVYKNLIKKKNMPPVLGADTVVALDGKILVKPKNKNDAIRMLSSLSGRSHFVYTGYTIIHPSLKKEFSRCIKSRVVFKKLTRSEIVGYASIKEPYDKAGAYAAQGLGAFIVEKIYGSYTNVVGLPLCEVISDLEKLGLMKLF